MKKDGHVGKAFIKSIFFREVLYEKAEGEGANLLKTNNTMKGFL